MTLAMWPSDTRNQIEEIIGMVGRNVDFFYVYSTYACPLCDLDPVTQQSQNPYCESCSGVYWIDVYSGVTMSAHVSWKFDYHNEFETGGLVFLGDAKVKVMHTAEREAIIKSSDYVVVDDKIMNVEHTTILGSPVNRIIVDVKEKED